jgi:hypothetical protein
VLKFGPPQKNSAATANAAFDFFARKNFFPEISGKKNHCPLIRKSVWRAKMPCNTYFGLEGNFALRYKKQVGGQ